MTRLAADLPGARWLDLCCGSGVMACEALQRGVSEVVAVDRDRRMVDTARANLEAVRCSLGREVPVQVLRRELPRWLTASGQAPLGNFDLIYVDPPYGSDLYETIGVGVSTGGWLAPNGRMVWECDRKSLPYIPSGLALVDERHYGGTSLLFLRGAGSASEGTTAPVLIPGGHEEAHEGHGNQTQHDAAEQGFDHGGARDAPVGTQ
jgi:16S rRNA (guanine(966)-N(2))-methyltransferase RsmD